MIQQTRLPDYVTCVRGLGFYPEAYVSFEYALSEYGLIPERVCAATFAVPKTDTAYQNKKDYFGRYLYYALPENIFNDKTGIILKNYDSRVFQEASPERALCDLIYSRITETLSREAIASLIIDGYRIDEENLADFDLNLLRQLGAIYDNKNIKNVYATALHAKNRYNNEKHY